MKGRAKKLSEIQLLRLRVTFLTLPLFYLGIDHLTFETWYGQFQKKYPAVKLRAKKLSKGHNCHTMDCFVSQGFDCCVIFSCERT